jgi:NAD(P)-dependent dehydrogenase (short-subunit alcohol dehydrogenase family)
MPSESPIRFDGRVAIVTGAGRGLGAEFAKLLSARGARVVVNDIAHAEEIVSEISQSGGIALANDDDISIEESAANLVAVAVDRFGRIDVIINNAGILIIKPFEETTMIDLDATLKVHLKGAWGVTSAAWPFMKEQGYGRILMVASANGVLMGTFDHCAYGTAKSGLTGLSRELAIEGASFGIQVNALLPGAATPMLDQNPARNKPGIAMDPWLVAPGAGWLVHEECDATGRMFVCSSGRIGEVFVSVTEGYQALVNDFSLEGIRENWFQVSSRERTFSPRTVQEYNQVRSDIYFGAGNN